MLYRFIYVLINMSLLSVVHNVSNFSTTSITKYDIHADTVTVLNPVICPKLRMARFTSNL